MIEKLYTNKCTALVGENGRALSGEALEAAEKAMRSACSSQYKLWSDRNGCCYIKPRTLFAAFKPLLDDHGRQVRICGKRVHIAAKFCSKCGSSAPHSYWRCGGCGKRIGNDTLNCPHCGKPQNMSGRLDMVDGNWQKNDEIFAERFEVADVIKLLGKGLNVQESQAAILLEGGAVTEVLRPGFYPSEGLDAAEKPNGEQSIIMVDKSEFTLPVCVDEVRSADDLQADVHAVVVLQFDPQNAPEFMRNLMGNSLYLQNDTLSSAVGYDEIAHCILQDIDASVRNFCLMHNTGDLFKDATIRIQLENHIASALRSNLHSLGLSFIRLKEMEFESAVFDKLRELSGQVEVQRREIEFMIKADELANNAARREAASTAEMEDYIDQLAHEKGIKDELRIQEIERIRRLGMQKAETADLSHENDLDDLQQSRQLERDRIDEEFKQEILDLHHNKELERRLAEQKSSLDYMQIEARIQEIKINVEKQKVQAEQEAAEGWIKLQHQKKLFAQQQKIELMNAAAKQDIKALLMAEEDPEKRAHLLQLHEQELQSKMTPELLLAAAAARGNQAAAEALSRMNKEQLDAIERSKAENKAMYDQMLQMSERMFNQATNSLAAKDSGSKNTTQIIK